MASARLITKSHWQSHSTLKNVPQRAIASATTRDRTRNVEWEQKWRVETLARVDCQGGMWRREHVWVESTGGSLPHSPACFLAPGLEETGLIHCLTSYKWKRMSSMRSNTALGTD